MTSFVTGEIFNLEKVAEVDNRTKMVPPIFVFREFINLLARGLSGSKRSAPAFPP
jgi:hypothetical protein